MLFNFLKSLAVVLLGTATYNIASAAPNDRDLITDSKENDVDNVYIARNAFAPEVCVEGKNDPKTCWNYNMGEHVIRGEPARCFGGHVTTAIQFAEHQGEITNSQPQVWDSVTSLILIKYLDGSHKSCSKTVWNNVARYPPTNPVSQYPPLRVQDMCESAVRYSNCVSGAVVVDTGFIDPRDRKPVHICVQVEIDPITDPTDPGKSCYPKYLSKNPNGPLGRVDLDVGKSCAHLS